MRILGKILAYLIIGLSIHIGLKYGWIYGIILFISSIIIICLLDSKHKKATRKADPVYQIDEEIKTLQEKKDIQVSFTESFKCDACGAVSKITIPGSICECKYCGSHIKEVDKRISDILYDNRIKYEHRIKELQQLKEETYKKIETDREYKLEQERIKDEKNRRLTALIFFIIGMGSIFFMLYMATRK